MPGVPAATWQPALVDGWMWNWRDALVSATPLLVITPVPVAWNVPQGVLVDVPLKLALLAKGVPATKDRRSAVAV